MENNEDNKPDKFSEDPEENTRLENEFLKMKIMAESGGVFGESENNLPAEMMNEWLKNIVEFEKSFDNSKEIKLSEILGNPEFKDESDLDDEQLETAFHELRKLLEKNRINIDFLRERDNRFRYSFITKELFQHESSLFPGMTTNFIYEEFHPDADLDIRNRTDEFFHAFFERRLGDSEHPYFQGEFILPDGKVLPAAEMCKRFQAMYDAIPTFENTGFEIEKVDFEFKEEGTEDGPEKTGLGYSEGTVQYDMIYSNGERRNIHGPFKIYLGMQWDWWSIYFFYLAGFNLPEKDKSSTD